MAEVVSKAPHFNDVSGVFIFISTVETYRFNPNIKEV
jgi:hypothetical protein